MFKTILLLLVVFLIFKGCDSASDFDVYYWKNVREGKPEDDSFIGTVKTLVECERLAMQQAGKLHEEWNPRLTLPPKNVSLAERLNFGQGQAVREQPFHRELPIAIMFSSVSAVAWMARWQLAQTTARSARVVF